MEKIYIFWKWLLSYRKKIWSVNDYPVRIGERGESQTGQPKFWARMIYTGFTGFGETKSEALADLDRVYEWVKANDPDEIERPGVRQPISFASREGLEVHSETEEKFINLVLGFDRSDPVFLSDESSIYDLGDKAPDLIDKTKEVFGIDISDIQDGNILKIIERIDTATD